MTDWCYTKRRTSEHHNKHAQVTGEEILLLKEKKELLISVLNTEISGSKKFSRDNKKIHRRNVEQLVYPSI